MSHEPLPIRRLDVLVILAELALVLGEPDAAAVCVAQIAVLVGGGPRA